MKTNRFLSLSAIFALSFTFFACSSDSSDPPGGEPSSSSPQQNTQVFCQLSGGTCSQMSFSTCMELVNVGSAQIVPNCNAEPPPPPPSSSSTTPPPPPSSSSSAPRSSSSPAASTRCKNTQGYEYFCEWGTRSGFPSENPGCFAIDPTYSDPPGRACSVLVDECNSYGTLYVSFTANSNAGGAGKRCDGTTITNDPNLVRKNITLSAAGSSFADIDGNVATYTRATAASRLDKIDLIAYCGTGTGWCERNSIYSPWEIDLFWTDYYDYLGGDVFFFEVPAAQAAVFKTATKRSEIASTLYSLLNIASEVDEIPIAAGKVFLVYTSEGEVRIVIIKSAGTQTVDLEIIQVPSN